MEMQRRARIYALHESADINTIDLCVGDVINCGSYRYTQAWIVGPNFTLIRNPDLSGSGYLTIPRSVTCCFEDAIAHYAEFGDEVTLILNPDDGGLVRIFGEAFPASYEIQFPCGVLDENMFITDTDTGKGCSFDVDTPYAEIIRDMQNLQKTRASFMIWYNVYGDDVEVLQRVCVTLPESWRCRYGPELLGDTMTFAIISFYGPKESYQRALDAVRTSYANFNIGIREGKKDDHMVCETGFSIMTATPLAYAPTDFRETPL